MNNSFKCDICDSVLQKGSLKSHNAAIHEGRKPHKCTICDANFSQKGNLNVHVASVHEEKKSFKCTICNASFA